MRRRERQVAEVAGAPPPELLIGKCVEVWAEVGAEYGSQISAFGRYNRARLWWAEQQGLTTAERCRVLRVGAAPWSVEFLIAQGRGELVEELLARGGVSVADVPRLRVPRVRREVRM